MAALFVLALLRPASAKLFDLLQNDYLGSAGMDVPSAACQLAAFSVVRTREGARIKVATDLVYAFPENRLPAVILRVQVFQADGKALNVVDAGLANGDFTTAFMHPAKQAGKAEFGAISVAQENPSKYVEAAGKFFGAVVTATLDPPEERVRFALPAPSDADRARLGAVIRCIDEGLRHAQARSTR